MAVNYTQNQLFKMLFSNTFPARKKRPDKSGLFKVLT